MRKDDILTLTGEKDACPSDKFSRRKFFGTAAMAAAGAALAPRLISPGEGPEREAAGRSPGRDQDQYRRGPQDPQGRDLAPREIPRQGGQGQDRGQSRRAEDRRGPRSAARSRPAWPSSPGKRRWARPGGGSSGPRTSSASRSIPSGRSRPLDQARGRGRHHRGAPGRRGPEDEHRHLGPAPLPAPGRRVHAGALPRHPHHGHGDEGPERRVLRRQGRALGQGQHRPRGPPLRRRGRAEVRQGDSWAT